MHLRLDIMIQINNEKDQTKSLKKNSRVANLPSCSNPPNQFHPGTLLANRIEGYIGR